MSLILLYINLVSNSKGIKDDVEILVIVLKRSTGSERRKKCEVLVTRIPEREVQKMKEDRNVKFLQYVYQEITGRLQYRINFLRNT